MESSRRDLLNDVAEHRSILKTNEKTPDGDSTFPMTPDRYSKH